MSDHLSSELSYEKMNHDKLLDLCVIVVIIIEASQPDDMTDLS